MITAKGANRLNGLLGWAATAVFALSYFVRNPVRMRLVQGAASILWILYGVAIHAVPIIVANVLVASLAIVSAVRENYALASVVDSPKSN
jgi:hypothetical protein